MDDDAARLLRLAAGLHLARGNPAAWAAAVNACRAWFGCTGALNFGIASWLPGQEDLEALAGRVTHCACYGTDACGGAADDAIKRARCAALAPHLHEAARAHRAELTAAVFDDLPPTWILARDASVQSANAAARTLIRTTDRLCVVAGGLSPNAPSGIEKLRRTLAGLDHETRFAWPCPDGTDCALLLRPLNVDRAVAATWLNGEASVAGLALRLADALRLSVRQSELAAHLLAGQSLAESARQMGISRDTANQHLSALLRRCGASDRDSLVVLLLGTVLR